MCVFVGFGLINFGRVIGIFGVFLLWLYFFGVECFFKVFRVVGCVVVGVDDYLRC